MSNLIRWDPFAELATLQKQFFGDDMLSQFKGVNIPTTDVYMKDTTMTVEAHLPHFKDDDVSVQVDGKTLVISAERHEKEEDKDKQYVVRESSSSFYRRIQLPERAETDNIEAELTDGVLIVRVPVTPVPEPKKITLKGN